MVGQFHWVLLTYSVASEPAAPRVYVWRKLKRLGAILVDGAAWVLPATPRTQEQFQWLAAEIAELGGEATLWEADATMAGQAEALVAQFLAQVDEVYAGILAELEGEDPDLVALSRRYQQAAMSDYFQSPLGLQVREKLVHARGGP
jgi:hypothetical protein